MIFDVINPSDAITFESENPAAMQVAFLLVTDSGMIGLEAVGPDAPHVLDRGFMYGTDGGEVYLAKLLNGYKDLEDFIMKNWEVMAASLESIVYGAPGDRTRFNTATEGMDAERLRSFRADWNDQKRSSMNNYHAAAIRTAKIIRERAEKEGWPNATAEL